MAVYAKVRDKSCTDCRSKLSCHKVARPTTTNGILFYSSLLLAYYCLVIRNGIAILVDSGTLRLSVDWAHWREKKTWICTFKGTSNTSNVVILSPHGKPKSLSHK